MKSNTGLQARVIPFDEPRPPEFSDEALALRFAECHAGRLRFIAAWGKWMVWDGRRWRFDETLHAFDRARFICREAASKANDPRVRMVVASAKTVAGVDRLAKSDRRLAATVDQWDVNPWLLNTSAGILDLRTGEMRPARIDDYATKITAVAPGGECPTWQIFLRRVTDDDHELIAFLRRVCGYSLTGITREQVLFFLYGTGGNGKGIFLSTVASILADYHTTAAVETFTASKSERHPTDLAHLRGARLVTATETEESRGWAESKIKVLTGGDKIAARFMRGNFFEFVPTFKLIIAGNHMPGLRSVDEAIRRRLHLIPFSVTIPPDDRDSQLFEKLKAEWPGILSWMIQGCLEWQRGGLQPPEVVKNATTAYLEAEDAIATWIDECCQRDLQAWETRSALYASFSRWAAQAGEPALPRKNFVQSLEDRGFQLQRRHAGRGFYGLRII
jgi:putative DNA primase/helicase